MNPYALLPLVGLIANLALAAAVFARSPRDRPNRVYALLCLSIAWWSVFKFARLLVHEDSAALLLFDISALGWAMFPSLYLDFVLAFTRRSEAAGGSWLARFAHGIGVALFASAFIPGAMATGIVWEPWGSSHRPGPVYEFYAFYLFLVTTIGIVLLVRARSRARNAAVKKQYTFILAGGLIPVLAGSITNVWLPIAKIYVVPLGEVLSTLNVAAVGWAMWRHGLLAVSLEQAAETIIATMGDALLVIDNQGDVVVANEAAGKILGRTPRQIVGHPVTHWVSADRLNASASEIWQEAAEFEGELAPYGGGDPVPVILSTRPVLDGTATVIGAVLVAKDIRQLRRAFVELAAANERLERQSITDELTGVSNRRHTNQRLVEEFDLATKYERPFSIGVLDLDDFKEVNDRFGHQMGDRVLMLVAREIKAVLRDADIVSRWGGDEFFVILGDANAEKARDIGARIVERIENANIDGLSLTIRASLGLATFDPKEPPADPAALVNRADAALYHAKRAGKGTVRDAALALDQLENAAD